MIAAPSSDSSPLTMVMGFTATTNKRRLEEVTSSSAQWMTISHRQSVAIIPDQGQPKKRTKTNWEGKVEEKSNKHVQVKVTTLTCLSLTDQSNSLNPSNQTKETDVKEEDEVMSDESSSAVCSSAVPFVPHGILKLPQSIASALASDFLGKREIRDLGVTCRWMLVSLNECSVNESISLSVAVERLKLVGDSQQVRQHLSCVRIGKFRNLSFLANEFTQNELNLVLEFPRLVDVRKLTFFGTGNTRPNPKRVACPTPLALPPHLKELSVEHWRQKFLPLTDLILPESLTKIVCCKHVDTQQQLTKVKWPPKLIELLNLTTEEPSEGLQLPPSLETLTFSNSRRGLAISCHRMNLPSSITSLTIHKFEDVNGRYRDLVFPSQLIRLVVTCEIGKNDFNLMEWAGLPRSCTNFELTIIPDHIDITAAVSSSTSDESSHIVLPAFIKHVRIFREKVAVPIDLSGANSLVSFVTDGLDKITWPVAASSKHGGFESVAELTHLKLTNCSGLVLISSTTSWPTCVTHLDLREVGYGWRDVLIRPNLRWSDLFVSMVRLTRVQFPTIKDLLPAVTLISLMREWNALLPKDCVLEGYIPTPHDMPSTYHIVPSAGSDSHVQLVRYVNGHIMDQTPLSYNEYHRAKAEDDECARLIFDPPTTLSTSDSDLDS